MRPKIQAYTRQKIVDYITAVTNICIFLPYFFSVKPLLKTLVKPWKNLISPPSKSRESLGTWFSRISFNWISSLVGFIARSALLFGYVTFQTLFVLVLPVASLLYFLFIPLMYIFSFLKPTEEERKKRAELYFTKHHQLDQKNSQHVSAWFEWYYTTRILHGDWWRLSSLLSIPPLARDWSYGFTPLLDKFSEDLTLKRPHYKNLIDRVEEINQIEQILSKSEQHNCIIVGDEGIGKHTIVEGFAKKIYEGNIASTLRYKRILKIDMTLIASVHTDFAKREEMLSELFSEANDAGNIIILIDNFDRYVAGGTDRMDLSSSIAQFAKSFQLQIIGITTPFAYEKFVIKNEKINGLFEKVSVNEITKESALQLLLTVVPTFESRFTIFIPYETICEIIAKSDIYITVIPFPEKAIDLLDETCVYAVETKKTSTVLPEMINVVLAKKTRGPVALDETIKNQLLTLEPELKKRIKAQDSGIELVARSIRKSFVAIGSRKKPLASVLLLGPTGVGKTETAKAVNEVFFKSEKSLIRFDMSLYQTKLDIPKLIGSEDSGNPGLLSAAIREQPYGVLLIDEIEKADHDLLNIFLTLFDEGYFFDGYGKRVDCRNLIVIATSNAGTEFINTLQHEGTTFDEKKFINFLLEKQIFLPEFLNRFDGVVVYKPLTRAASSEIVVTMLAGIAKNIESQYGVKIVTTPEFVIGLVEKGYDPQFGARTLSRTIRDEVEDKIAQLVLENKIKKGETITF